MNFSVVPRRRHWYAFSAAIIAVSVLSLIAFGLRQGIEFTGGSLMGLQFSQRPVMTEMQAFFHDPLRKLGSVVVQPVDELEYQIRMRTLSEDEHQVILKALITKYPNVVEQKFQAIGPVIGEELRKKSVSGLLLVLAGILVYVAFVFRKVSAPVQSWKYGVITILTAFHDVIIPLGVFSLLGRFFGWEIGTPFVAAILTILGYSITDTIVVMDRVRENLQKTTGTFADIVEQSVHQTFLRSFNTSMATLLTLFAILFFGGKSLHEFTLALIIGIAVGTYSSIFIASPLLVSWEPLCEQNDTKVKYGTSHKRSQDI